MTKKKAPEDLLKRGPKSSYDPQFANLTWKLCLLGLTNKELAAKFNVSEATFQRWLEEFPEMRLAVENGREKADAEVAVSLRQRALGYSHQDHVVTSFQGVVTLTPVTKHYPPDTAAASLWLRNRHPKRWRGQPEEGNNSTAEDIAREAQAAILAALSTTDGAAE